MANTLKAFDLEFQPFIDEIDAKEGVIREFADAASMDRIRSMLLSKYGVGYSSTLSNVLDRIDIEGAFNDITSELKRLAKLDG